MSKLGYSPYDNLESLWKAEDDLLSWAKEMIADTDHLLAHLELAETYMSTVHAMREILPMRDDRAFALGALFLRTFDHMSCALRAVVSGNYTGCVIYTRDLLETQFLISHLLDDDSRPVEWLFSSVEDVKKKYAPYRIRMALDERDGFTSRKREAHYKRLSTLGSHPTPQSLELKRDGGRILHNGPLKHRELLGECIEEVAMVALTLGGVLVSYLPELPNGTRVSSRLSIILQKNYEKSKNV